MDLSARIEATGNPTIAQQMRQGMCSLNGLTDGWAMFLESLERCGSSPSAKITARESAELGELTAYVRKLVCR